MSRFAAPAPAGPSPRRRARLVLAAAAALAVPAFAAAQPRVHTSQLHDFRVVTVVDGLENPWSIAWLPDGDMLVTERPGRLRIVRDGALLAAPVTGVPAVRTGGQGGLSGQHQRLSRLTVEGGTVTGREPLLLGEYRIRDVREGPDGFIYLAIDHRVGNPTPILRLEPAAD